MLHHIGRLAPGFSVRAIDFGEQRRQDRRAGRHLDHFDTGTFRQRHGMQLIPQGKGDVMARPVAVALFQQVDLKVSQLRRSAQEIVADQAIKIEWSRGASIGLDGFHLLDLVHGGGQRKQRALGFLQSRAFRHVEHNLDFRLVVERQQFDCDRLGRKQRERQKSGNADNHKKNPGILPARNDWPCDRSVELAQPGFLMLRMATDRCISGNLHQQPGRDADRDKEGKEHGCGRVRGNGCHIGAHQPGHEHHGQQGRDDSQCGDNCWVTNFRYGINGGLYARPAIPHVPVSGNVFDHDDRIINQNTDREDQGKQADPVDCVAHHQRRKQRQQNSGRNDNECDQRFAPADREGDQDHN